MFVINYKGRLPSGLATPVRGEDRWCLNAAAALLSRGYRVGLLSSDWGTPHIPDNLVLGVTESEIESSVFLTYGQASEALGWPSARFYVLNYYAFPNHLVPPGNSIVTQCYKEPARELLYKKRFGEQYSHLTHPAVSNVTRGNPVLNNRIVWTARHLLCSDFGTRVAPLLLQWAAHKMEEDEQVEFYFITGEPGGPAYLEKSGQLRPFDCVYDRVHLMGEIPWDELLGIIGGAKTILNFGNFDHTYGGSVLEAASFGIPSVCFANGAFSCLPGAPRVHDWRSEKLLSTVDRLYTDRDYYQRVGDLYRDHVECCYTYDVFVNQLLVMLRGRGVCGE